MNFFGCGEKLQQDAVMGTWVHPEMISSPTTSVVSYCIVDQREAVALIISGGDQRVECLQHGLEVIIDWQGYHGICVAPNMCLEYRGAQDV